jgi:DNA-directed RNA polymerase specialized sigma24 family protein
MEKRAQIVIADLILVAHNAAWRRSFNEAMMKEIERAGVVTDEPIDFWNLVDRAVRSRFSPGTQDYDDAFQDVSMELMGRSGTKKRWIQSLLKTQEKTGVVNVRAWLATAANRLVKDLFRSVKTVRDRHEQIGDGTEEGGGYSLERHDTGGISLDDASAARELYRKLMAFFQRSGWDPAPIIFKSLVKNEITGYTSRGRVRGLKDLHQDLERELGRTVQYSDVGQYYRKKFTKLMDRALSSLGGEEAEVARRMFAASMADPMVKLIRSLDEIASRFEA